MSKEFVQFSATQVLKDNNEPKETDKGRCLELQDREEWFPKSQLTQIDDVTWEIPMWLAREKDING